MWEWIKKVASAAKTDSAVTSLTIVSSVVGFVAVAVNAWYGVEVISTAEQAEVVEKGKAVWDAGVMLWAAGVAAVSFIGAAIGRFRAKMKIGGGALK